MVENGEFLYGDVNFLSDIAIILSIPKTQEVAQNLVSHMTGD